MNLCTREEFCPQKMYCPGYFNVGVNFYVKEIATAESGGTELPSRQASVSFCNVDIRAGTGVTYFFNTDYTYTVSTNHNYHI